ncbi:hypothetical protein [Microseira sp. BLCC-F43]|jgi:hypothetical protein
MQLPQNQSETDPVGSSVFTLAVRGEEDPEAGEDNPGGKVKMFL